MALNLFVQFMSPTHLGMMMMTTVAMLTTMLLVLLTLLEVAVAIIQDYVFVLLLSLYLQENV